MSGELKSWSSDDEEDASPFLLSATIRPRIRRIFINLIVPVFLKGSERIQFRFRYVKIGYSKS